MKHLMSRDERGTNKKCACDRRAKRPNKNATRFDLFQFKSLLAKPLNRPLSSLSLASANQGDLNLTINGRNTVWK